MVEVMKIMLTSFKRSFALIAALSDPNAEAGCCRPTSLLETLGHTGKSGSVSCGVTVSAVSPGSWCTRGFVCALQESVSPVLCKFWRFYSRVNGDILEKGWCHQALWLPGLLYSVPLTPRQCTTNPCSPEAPGLAQASLAQSLWGHCSFLPGPGAHKVLFVPSKSLFPQSCAIFFKCCFPQTCG